MTDPMTLPVTQWFEGKPSCPGIWEVTSDVHDQRLFQCWNGDHWGVMGYSPQDALKWGSKVTRFPPTLFRGLAVNPNFHAYWTIP